VLVLLVVVLRARRRAAADAGGVGPDVVGRRRLLGQQRVDRAVDELEQLEAAPRDDSVVYKELVS